MAWDYNKMENRYDLWAKGQGKIYLKSTLQLLTQTFFDVGCLYLD